MIVVNDGLKKRKMAQDFGSKPENFKTQCNECPTISMITDLFSSNWDYASLLWGKNKKALTTITWLCKWTGTYMFFYCFYGKNNLFYAFNLFVLTKTDSQSSRYTGGNLGFGYSSKDINMLTGGVKDQTTNLPTGGWPAVTPMWQLFH